MKGDGLVLPMKSLLYLPNCLCALASETDQLDDCHGRSRESDVATRREHVRGLRESI